MTTLRFALVGTGFWSRYQLAAWREVEGVECVALCNRTRAKAEALAREFGVPAVYDDPRELLQTENIDFLDVTSDVTTHSRFVHLAVEHRVPVICQKPMAPALAEAQGMVAAARAANVPFFIHENWRWQTPIRQLHEVLVGGTIGRPFRARIDMISGFPVFENQPFLKTLEQFILTDMGSHILDVARFLFGEARSLYCQTRRIHEDIAGEDVATVMLRMGDDITVLCQMAYAGTPLEHERFPETYIFVEGDQGSVELGPDYWVRVTTASGTHSRRYPPPRYDWSDPVYDVVHASIVPCNADLLAGLRGTGQAETTAADNLKTMQLVFAAYDSAAEGRAITW